jgi:hypothetical protein
MSTEPYTPRTDSQAVRYYDDASGNRVEYIPSRFGRQLERELAHMTQDRDQWRTVARADLLELINKIHQQAERIRYLEGATNHAAGTPLSKAIKQRDELAEALREMLKFTPTSLSCQDFHHPAKYQNHESDDCQPAKRFHEALEKAEQALAAMKGGEA